MTGIAFVKHLILKSAWTTSRWSVPMTLIHQNVTLIKVVATISSAIWICLVIRAVHMVAPAELNQAAPSTRKDTQIVPHRTTEEQRLEVTIVIPETVRASPDTWNHKPRLVLMNVQTLLPQLHGVLEPLINLLVWIRQAFGQKNSQKTTQILGELWMIAMAKDMPAMTESLSFPRSLSSQQFAPISLLLLIQPSFLVVDSPTTDMIMDAFKTDASLWFKCKAFSVEYLSTHHFSPFG